MRSLHPATLCLALICALSVPVSHVLATTYVIRPDGTGDFPTIQAAIDACVDGDVVQLTDGTFAGDGNRDIAYLGKAITVASQGGAPESCVIDCEGSAGDPHRGILFVSGETPASILEGITIRNAHADSCGAVLCRGTSPTLRHCNLISNTVTGNGGGIGCTGGASPSLTSCRLELNHAGEKGGALYCRFGANPSLVGCTLENNSSDMYGGAMHSRGCAPSFEDCLLVENSTAFLGGVIQNIGGAPAFTSCVFRDNVSAAHAGAVHSQYGDPSFTDCEFLANHAGDNGGAALFTLTSNPLLTRCRFEANTCGQSGGAITSRHDALPTLVECRLIENTAYWNGGALSLYDGGLVVISNCLIAGNTAQSGHGGAVSAGAHSVVTMSGSTLHDNHAADAGRAVRIYDQSELTMQNCIVSHGGSGLVACSQGGIAELVCCDLFGAGGDEWVGCLAGQGGVAGNFTADPLYCDAAGGDWNLDESSPCAPGHSGGCGLIGALPVGCGATAVEETTWGAIKALF